MQRLIKICLIVFLSLLCPALSLTAGASSPVVCPSGTECRISIYRSALPSDFANHTIIFVSLVDVSGDIIPITGNQITLKYDGAATQVVCNGSVQNFIPATSYTEIQNKVTCTIENEGKTVRASFILYDQ